MYIYQINPKLLQNSIAFDIQFSRNRLNHFLQGTFLPRYYKSPQKIPVTHPKMSESTSTTTTAPILGRVTLRGDSLSAPKKLSIDLSKYEVLDHKQAGHLRHFHNLASQPPGEWAFMGAADPAQVPLPLFPISFATKSSHVKKQEWLDAYRYQLATMAYGASVAHYHRLPALRSPFKILLRQLIEKMLRREVWGYWYLTSQSGIMVNPDIKELRKPWADPVVRENIMVSPQSFVHFL